MSDYNGLDALVIDATGRVWEVANNTSYYRCISTSTLFNYTLEELNEKCGPLHLLDRGAKLEFTPLSNGRAVEIDLGDGWNLVAGTVVAYNKDSQSYDVVIKADRGDVKPV